MQRRRPPAGQQDRRRRRALLLTVPPIAAAALSVPGDRLIPAATNSVALFRVKSRTCSHWHPQSAQRPGVAEAAGWCGGTVQAQADLDLHPRPRPSPGRRSQRPWSSPSRRRGGLALARRCSEPPSVRSTALPPQEYHAAVCDPAPDGGDPRRRFAPVTSVGAPSTLAPPRARLPGRSPPRHRLPGSTHRPQFIAPPASTTQSHRSVITSGRFPRPTIAGQARRSSARGPG